MFGIINPSIKNTEISLCVIGVCCFQQQQLSSASPDPTGSSNGAHPARLYHDVNEEVVGWTHQIDIRSDLERERI